MFDVPGERYVFRDDPTVLGGVAFDHGRVFFFVGDTLLVGDLESGSMLFEIKYLLSAIIKAFQQEFSYDGRNAYNGVKIVLIADLFFDKIHAFILEAILHNINYAKFVRFLRRLQMSQRN
ncbi:hypothetical protein UNDKW_2542 [Undibacterium sp. KW1]|uniref:hypothetical protein n=1 Tax=Undibacterium sp. KW1 TaxID=2058624 RepID=UPI001331CFD5|nr:hypothetical protein [Undibacterium sp. KW1]BBB60815.1 hypothetical protein UNDKW_2542 [Undibacterium sp. KW1]